MSIIKMNDFFKISIAEAFDEYELHCKARNLSKNTLKRHLEVRYILTSIMIPTICVQQLVKI